VRHSSGSSEGPVAAAKLVYARVQQFLVSLKKVAVTTYHLVPVRNKAIKTRAELEKIRQNNESLVPLTLLVMCQFVPILGNIPVLIALAAPRFLLTSCFLNEEQLAQIRAHEFNEKIAARIQLDKLTAAESLDAQGKSLVDLADDHMSSLSKANALYANTLIYRALTTPLRPISATFIRRKLVKRTTEIASDDVLLKALQLESLELSELLTACTMRGSSPTLNKEECLAYLRRWVSGSGNQKETPLLLCHRIARGLPP